MPSPEPPSLFPDEPDHRRAGGDWWDWLSSWWPRPPPAVRGVGLAVGAAVAVVVAVGAVVLVVGHHAGSGAPAVSLPMAHGPGSSSPDGTAVPAPAGAAPLVVQAAGAVNRPGVYHLTAGARVGDLIDAAGGLTPQADPDRINLAAPVADGARVYVLRRGEADPGPATDGGAGGGDAAGTGPSAGATPAPIDLNQATEAQLEDLPGVGPATAAAIVEDRRRHGPFASVDDLARVRGIGPAKLEALRSRVRV